MTNLPKHYFRDISAELMAEIAMGLADDHAFTIAQCESRNHREHRGELWQCVECLRVFCWEEGAGDSGFDKCDDCWARLVEMAPSPSFA